MSKNKQNRFLGIILVILVLLSGCGQSSEASGEVKTSQVTREVRTSSPPQTTITVENFPRVDGSTSTYPLDMQIACELLETPCLWVEGIEGARYLLPDVTDFEGKFPEISHHGTHGSYVNLINGDSDLIFVARLPSADELKLAGSMGVELMVEEIALDAFVFIVNEDNPVDDLTIEEIRGIYTGEIINWRELGGWNEEIHPYQRNENSGSQELMKSLVMKDLKMIDAPDMVLPKMIGPFYAVSDDSLGIGYSVYFYEEYMAPNELVKLCSIDEVMPDSKNIQAQKYPFTTFVYAVIRSDQPQDSLAYWLRDWVLSIEGQAVIAESGYVPLP